MSTYNQIAWLPLCGGLTGLGLVLSWLAGRRRGFRAMLRGVAWSLLPLAAYLTGAIEMFWKMGAAIGTFATSFVFSPKVWSGIAVAGFSVVLFTVSGGLRRRRVKAGPGTKTGAGTKSGPGTQVVAPGEAAPAVKPAKGQPKSGAGADDDMREVEEILRRRGIS
jgi:hypothetical protein